MREKENTNKKVRKHMEKKKQRGGLKERKP